MSQVQDTLDRIGKHKGVLGCIIAGTDGSIHKTTLDEQLTQDYTSMVPSLTALARNMVRELDPQNDLEFLRVRSAKHEVMVAPKGDYVLIVIQDAAP
ncbi:hypothetical protein OEZ86_006485 [Tetradesmus obliquus]|nr:hypothetical protein OEZ86_006485 [Tetradesmus obliquus]